MSDDLRIRLCLAVLTVAAFPAPSGATANSYLEDFTTTAYRDAVGTTADWNTVDGELKLLPFTPSLIGTYDTPGSADGVDVSGRHAFVADGGSGLHVIDISASPVLVGTYDTSDYARGVQVSGRYAFVAGNTGGLQVIDISDPTAPVQVGALDTGGFSWAVDVSGDRAYLADGTLGLRVLDISDPTAPALVGFFNTSGDARDVHVSGDHAYVADGLDGLRVLDVSDPTSPALIGTYDTPGRAFAVHVWGDHAYVADGTSGLQVIDVSNPAAPGLAGTLGTSGTATGIHVSGDQAYVADDSAGLQVIDISDPTAPAPAGSHDTPGNAKGVVVSGGVAFVADTGSGLHAVTVSLPASPVLAGAYDTPGASLEAVISGDHAFLADDAASLQVIDISNPAAPFLAGAYDTTSGFTYGLDVSGNHAYLAHGLAGLIVVDVSDPSLPVRIAISDTPGHANGVHVRGNHAFVADGSKGLQVIDISDPAAPDSVGAYDTPGTARDVYVRGGLAYVADGSSGLQLIDISDPTAPVLVGTIATGSTYDVVVSGAFAYVAAGGSGLHVIDVSDPTTPAEVGSYDAPGFSRGVDVSGTLAYLAVDTAGFRVVDISNPSAPVGLDSLGTPWDAYDVSISGDHAFVADHVAGLQVIQVSQRDFDTENGRGQSLAVDAAGDVVVRARLAAAETGMVSWDLSADGGSSWQTVVPDSAWVELTTPGTDLVWRSTHEWAPGTNSAVSQLSVEWLNDFAKIEAVTDIPNDQGKQVRVEWTRSAHDFVGDASQIVEYAVYREIDPDLPAASMPVRTIALDELSPAARENARMMRASGWDFLLSVPVLVEDSYAVVVPTLADSTIVDGDYRTTFRVTALTATPGVFFHSPPDSGYSLDNLAPSIPGNLSIAYHTGNGNSLTWEDPTDPDFQFFHVYRSTDPGFDPMPADLVHTTTSTGWTDPDHDGDAVYYRVTATDFSGNESEAASAGTVTSVPAPALPDRWALHGNGPNPFAARTEIRYSVPAPGGDISLRVYDVGGRLVRSLVSTRGVPGERSVIWDGRDDGGRTVASGVYLYRLTARGVDVTRKMVLTR